MILGTKARYAVMAMVELAGRDAGVPVALADIADRQEITLPYLEQIFARLRVAGLVQSLRGPGGGYVLARDAAQITVAEVVQATDESLKITRCESEEKGCMSKKTRCVTHHLWEGMERQISEYLSGITLADLCAKGAAGVQGAAFSVDKNPSQMLNAEC